MPYSHKIVNKMNVSHNSKLNQYVFYAWASIQGDIKLTFALSSTTL